MRWLDVTISCWVSAYESTASLAALLLATAVAVLVAVSGAGGGVAQSRTLTGLKLLAADSNKVGAGFRVELVVHGADGSLAAILVLTRVAASAHSAPLLVVRSVNIVLAVDPLAILGVLIAILLINRHFRLHGADINLLSWGSEHNYN